MEMPAGIAASLDRLTAIAGLRATTAGGVLDEHGRSEAYHEHRPPDVVVFPTTTQDVVQIVTACNSLGLPIIPYGAGTSLEGHTAAVEGGVCIDFSQMNSILRLNDKDMDVVVQPGITRKELNAQLRDSGLFFPIDPGADASIGGMASTRASGTMAVRYETMKDNTLALEVVLADGRVIRTGSRARKSSAGYDLTRLFVGSEGTLGIITELTVKLHARPQAISAATCSFGTLHEAVEAAITVIQSAIPVARIELLDDVMMRGINLYSGLGYAEAPTLFLEFHGTESGVAEQATLAEAIAAAHGGLGFQWARAMITDVCVPISRLAECLVETRRDIDANGLIAPVVGHVGDGHFHLLILIDPADTDETARAKALHARLIARALAMEGTCTGEHGIGLGKIDFLEDECGDAVGAMRAIKVALDPDGMMNPGKIFRSASDSRA